MKRKYSVTNNIKLLLSERGKSMGWLAREVGMERSVISTIISRNKDVRLTTAFRIAGALGCTINDLWSL